jgi:hypothetical protein
MGMEPSYVFRFKVGQIGNPHIRPTKSSRIPTKPRLEQLAWVWQRIWSAASNRKVLQPASRSSEKKLRESNRFGEALLSQYCAHQAVIDLGCLPANFPDSRTILQPTIR